MVPDRHSGGRGTGGGGPPGATCSPVAWDLPPGAGAVAWQLRMTVEPPTGTVPAGGPKVGTTALQTVSLSTVCAATGQCTATLARSAGGILPIYDNSVDFDWYPSTGLTHAGSSYSGTTPRSGYGGPGIPPCRPPSDLQHDVLTLTVLQADEDAAGGWRATMVSGTEVSPEGSVCVDGAGQSTGAERIGLLAVPVGQTLPPSTSLSCAAPASATASPIPTCPPSPRRWPPRPRPSAHPSTPWSGRPSPSG
jgi:hypothetical protein